MKVDCNECGSSLPIEETTRFVTCAKCASRLAIKRSETAIYTEVLGEAGVTVLQEELATLEAHADTVASRPSSSAESAESSESVLRIIVGALVIASDIYWWLTNPSLQSLYARILLLAAGIWLLLSGTVKAVASARARIRLAADAKASVSRRREELQRTIAAESTPPRAD